MDKATTKDEPGKDILMKKTIALAWIVCLPAFPALAAGVDLSFGTIPAGDEVYVEFDVVVNQETPPTTPSVSAFGLVNADNAYALFTDDPDVGGPTDPTVTPILIELDYGDAGDPPYPTLASIDGARHVLRYGMHLGTTADADADGQPNGAATGDDLDAQGDDDDGVVLARPLAGGTTATFEITASEVGLLNAWVDFNGDGDWSDAGEQVFMDRPLQAGTQALEAAVPEVAADGKVTARFRFSSEPGLSPVGVALDGEVEDYLVRVIVGTRLSIDWTGPGITVRGQGGAHRVQDIEYTEQLLPVPAWQHLGTRTADGTGRFEIADPQATNTPRRAYRSVQP